MEIWERVRGYEESYKVSTYGRVKSLSRKSRRKERIMSPIITRCGYLLIQLWSDGHFVSRSIHRMVAEAFIPNIYSKPQVNHINSNRADNAVGNLEWVTASENSIHGIVVGKRRIARGQNIWSSILTEDQVIEIKRRYVARKTTQQMLATEFGVSRSTVGYIITGKNWKHIL